MPMQPTMMRLILAGAIVAQLGHIVAPMANSSKASINPDATQIQAARPAASAMSDFGLKMTVEMAARQPRKNIFVSPLSVFLALSMAEAGSEGKTRAAIRHGLSVPESFSEVQLHNSAAAVLKSLRSQTGVELDIANALWSDPSLPLSPQYVERCRQLFAAQATSLDLRQPAAASSINDWVKQNTHGKIPTIVSPEVLRNAEAVLTNAVYFRGRWQEPFPRNQTQSKPFHLAGGPLKQVQMMHASSISRAYHKGDGFEAAVLGYEGSEIQFFAILPDPGKRPEEVLARLPLKGLLASGVSSDLDLSLPRFTLDYSANLNAQLKAMGMAAAFDPGKAEFGPMGSPQFFISDVLHKTRVEVDEEGTVAAASTSITLQAAAAVPREKKTLVFDRPFAVFLCDTATGAVLFSGVVYDPQ
jgi:serine protease inhibitor